MSSKNLIGILLGALVYFFASPLLHAESVKTIQVNGQASVSVVPDEFHFSIHIEEKGRLVTKLNQTVSQKSERLVKLLLEHGLQPKQVQSMNIQLQPWYERGKGYNEQKGFVLSRRIDVVVTQLEKFDLLIDTLLKAGATGLTGFQYQVSKKRNYYLDALDLAVTDAELRAAKLAYSIGAKVGKVVEVVESSGYQNPQGRRMMSSMSEAGGYLPGEVAVTANVRVVFELLP